MKNFMYENLFNHKSVGYLYNKLHINVKKM